MSEIVIYSTPFCYWCERAKELITKKGFKFTSYDVSENKEAYDEMLKKSGQSGVPVIEINGKIIIGYGEEEICKLLDFAGH